MDCSLPGSSVHGIFQAWALEWGAIAFSEMTSLENINNLRDADDTTLTAESEEELKSVLMKKRRVENRA